MWNPDHIESVKQCGLCGSVKSIQLTVRSDNLPIHKCLNCEFAFLGKRPDATALVEYYNRGYFEESQTYQDYYNYAQAIYDLNYCPRLHRLAPFVSDWKGLNILEIGCAAGGTLALLRKKGAIVSGIEISEEACSVAKEQFGLDLIRRPLEEVSLPVNAYDMILMFDVLEHLQKPSYGLDQIYGSLVMGGYLAVTVPNFDRFEKEGADWPGIRGYWEHLNYFKSEVLFQKLSGMGFQMIETHTYTSGLTSEGTPEDRSLKLMIGRMRKRYPLLSYPLRLARKLKHMIKGPQEINRFYDGQGMDLFVLVRKKG